MFESLRNIQNPFARSLTAALTACSVVTFASAIAIATTQTKGSSAYKTALYSALVGSGCGALFGLVCTENRKLKRLNHASQNTQSIEKEKAITWHDWRNFLVTRKVKESEEITSFYLQPEDQGEIPNFLPGQFLTIKLNIPGQTRPVIRTYSLSDYSESAGYYRLSVKREPMPSGLEVPPGLASNFLHDSIQEGSTIQAKPPSGRFVLNVEKTLPAVLISNGVGITPMISMAKAMTRLTPERLIWFVHGARDGQFHAFRDEVRAIAEQNPNLMIHYAYSRPRAEDAGHYHSVGYVDSNLIQSLVKQEAEYYLCGSPPFLESILTGLKNAGIPENQVFFEMFTKASKVTVDHVVETHFKGSVGESEVIFVKSNKTAFWNNELDNLLDFAEANNVEPPYSCRQGICGTCMCKILEGEVEYQAKPVTDIEPGSILICIARPKTSRVILDL
ncbi:MAG TPA: 2Fe-2S iron-sulfur cluster binding domain-containing protein [Leptolyngbyaceae cyanobacterium M33_DOE_097]|uniref:2Fe-2S iron-sulfur cluster binding domain-containing protein n=1 Tax=Oscillatoriales cyanobacterium SpSt-418 TaxID=2282169 RepID=A0A7C3KDG1_9CYAN|nr:2Fe-2S iron-sulfur cluster binding domain-containing protein [Leptolyngbyaceae cyanobacterium M33_DOE_097]